MESLQTPEAMVAAYRAQGYEAEIVNGEVQVSFNLKKRETSVDPSESVSAVLAPDGKPVGATREVILPRTSNYQTAVEAIVSSGQLDKG